MQIALLLSIYFVLFHFLGAFFAYACSSGFALCLPLAHGGMFSGEGHLAGWVIY